MEQILRLNLSICLALTNVTMVKFKETSSTKLKTQRCIMQDTMINVPIEVLPLLGISNICFNSKQPHFTGFHYGIV